MYTGTLSGTVYLVLVFLESEMFKCDFCVFSLFLILSTNCTGRYLWFTFFCFFVFFPRSCSLFYSLAIVLSGVLFHSVLLRCFALRCMVRCNAVLSANLCCVMPWCLKPWTNTPNFIQTNNTGSQLTLNLRWTCVYFNSLLAWTFTDFDRAQNHTQVKKNAPLCHQRKVDSKSTVVIETY